MSILLSIFALKFLKSMLIFNYYLENERDRVWFDSSNIIYAECWESDTQYKDVVVTFKDGRQYKYKDVFVYDWRSFKEAESQGKALNTYIAKKDIQHEKLDSIANVDELKEECSFRVNEGLFIQVGYEVISLFNNKDEIIYKMDRIENIEEHIKGILEAIGKQVRIVYIN
jgi:uncharacterized protein YbaA (DUF1428 family)